MKNQKSKYMPKQVEFDWVHNDPTDCQVFLALTGSKKAIIENLEKLIKECKDSYGKPIQGSHIHNNCKVDVSTPIWEGKSY